MTTSCFQYIINNICVNVDFVIFINLSSKFFEELPLKGFRFNEMSLDNDNFYLIRNSTRNNHLTTTSAKFLYSSGPVDSKINYTIPFDVLPWGKDLIQAVDHKQAILLHGHWQSGKTSALRFIKSRAEEKGITVYYLDMMAAESALEMCLLAGQSIFDFLTREISGLNESLPNFSDVLQFCKWTRERHQGMVAPILLIDEYDAFLKVGRKDPRLLLEMNTLISYNRNTQNTFWSIVCAGTFSIVATQTEVNGKLKKENSDDSLDAVMRPFDVVSPCFSPYNQWIIICS